MPRGCVIFDFDGVIADTEALHHAVYNATLDQHAPDIGGKLEISRQAYFGRYIVYGDREGFFHMLRDAGRPHDSALIDKLAATKHHLFTSRLSTCAEPLPGVRETLEWLEARNVPRAICSGARKGEIVELLDAFQLRHHFDILVTIEDVTRGKPDPQGYNLCFDRLNLEYDAELDKDYSLVIEDSAGGCSAAQAAGLRVLGVATSLPVHELKRCATYAVESLDALDKDTLATWLGV